MRPRLQREGLHVHAARVRAWSVHFYTSLGLAVALLALIAAAGGRAQEAFIFLALAVVIDSTDGFLARRWNVNAWAPQFDGRKLDDITDYLNYTFIPVFFAYRFGLVPAGWEAVLGLTLIASAYGFSQKAAKTSDGYFTGFPSYWNVAVFYLYVLHWPVWLNGLFLAVLAVMVFVPLKYLYPSQTPTLRAFNIVLAGAWGALALWILIRLQQPDLRIVYLSLLYPAYYMALPIYALLRPRLGTVRAGTP